MRLLHSPSGSGWHALLALSVLLWSTPPARAEKLPIKFYSTADGLAHNTVYKIVRDSRGFLWFCTFGGLSRFDGYSFTTYGVAQGLPSQIVRDLLETRDGQYWIATDAGLCQFNPNGIAQKSPTARTSQSSASPMCVTHVPGTDRVSKVVTSVLQDRVGRIWCGTLGGLYRLEQQDGHVGLQRVPSIHRVVSMIEDRGGTLWVGSVGGIDRLLPDGRVEQHREGALNSRVQSILEDAAGHLWAATSLGGLWRLVSDPGPAASVIARAYTRNDGLPTDEINAVFQATDGRLWAGSDHGLIRVMATPDASSVRFRNYAEPDGFSYPIVHALSEDRNGNLWLGTSGGAAKFARSGITAFTDADGFSETSAIFKDQAGNLFVVGDRSKGSVISRYDGERFVRIQPVGASGIGVEQIWRDNHDVLQDHTGEWWVGTRNGVYRFAGAGSLEQAIRSPTKATYTTLNGMASNDVARVFEDSRGDIWVATTGGLSRWDRLSETFHRYLDRDGWLWRDIPVSLAEDRAGAVWIGLSIGGGLVRYRDGRFTRFTAADGLPEGGILALFTDSSGRLWVPVSPGGLCRIDHPEAERPVIALYTTAEGLAGNDVEAVTEDSRGRIYLGSAFGIDRLDVGTGRIRHYTSNEGALRGGVGPALRDRYGTLWFRYETGLVRLIPETDSPSIQAPVLITGLRIAGEAQPISALGETSLAHTDLPAHSDQIQIDFVAPGLGPGDESHYEYKLEGAGGNWSALGEQRTVNFARLAPGRYRFLVRATNADGVLSDRPARFAFTILPPFWQRWWFVTGAAIALLLVGHAVHRYRVTRLLELERVRTRIAADLHDDIGSSLSQISILSEVLRTQLGAQETAVSGVISLINRVSHEALDSMSDIVWAINPRQDHLSDLVRRMRRAASEVLPAAGIEFTFSAPGGRPLRLGPDTRRQVFLMFKEALNNIVRHARCARADIELKLEGPSLALVIADNGSGFDPHQVSTGNGLVSLQRRARALGGEILISSRRGEGTTVTITIPYGHQWHLGSGARQPPHGATRMNDRGSTSE